jgi:hypothetical protein
MLDFDRSDIVVAVAVLLVREGVAYFRRWRRGR